MSCRYSFRVVSLPFSTSSHNYGNKKMLQVRLYLFPFLHQATTWGSIRHKRPCCISSLFYIKPQHYGEPMFIIEVVSLPFSTSSHNVQSRTFNFTKLYLFPFLHQATTCHCSYPFFLMLYLFPFLHQATTSMKPTCTKSALYLFPFLHQATTHAQREQSFRRCISSLFYIKPQREPSK